MNNFNREQTMIIKCGTWLFILFYGEPDLMSALIDLIGRIG